ncbi:hypothetical protein TcBrA4_0049000 [Trypanosoma cruzi]|nr:hypothetical protein TcBrA4_0049000 [Trypanosoma cruzi]
MSLCGTSCRGGRRGGLASQMPTWNSSPASAAFFCECRQEGGRDDEGERAHMQREWCGLTVVSVKMMHVGVGALVVVVPTRIFVCCGFCWTALERLVFPLQLYNKYFRPTVDRELLDCNGRGPHHDGTRHWKDGRGIFRGRGVRHDLTKTLMGAAFAAGIVQEM